MRPCWLNLHGGGVEWNSKIELTSLADLALSPNFPTVELNNTLRNR